MAFTAHGHHIPGTILDETRPEKVMRCGGVSHCKDCKREAEMAAHPSSPLSQNLEEQTPSASAPVRFRKLPVEFDAIQFSGYNLEEVRAFCGVRFVNGEENEIFNPMGTYLHWLYDEKEHPPTGELWVEANQTYLPIEVGEWVVKDKLGFYPCKDEIIKANNEPVEDGPSVWPAELTDPENPTFGQELVTLLNKHSMERYSGTPDWILGNFLEMVLRQFDCAVMMRADWRGESVELPALNDLRGGRQHEVPLVMYTNGQRNEIGVAKVAVTPGEVHASGTIVGAVPIFGVESLSTERSLEVEEPKDEPLDAMSGSEATKEAGSHIREGVAEGMSAFDRYQKKGLTDG